MLSKVIVNKGLRKKKGRAGVYQKLISLWKRMRLKMQKRFKISKKKVIEEKQICVDRRKQCQERRELVWDLWSVQTAHPTIIIDLPLTILRLQTLKSVHIFNITLFRSNLTGGKYQFSVGRGLFFLGCYLFIKAVIVSC